MRTKPMTPKVTKPSAEKVAKAICRETRRQFSAEEKIRIVLEGLRGEDSISELCRRESIASSLYYVWSKEFWRLARSVCPGMPPVRRRRMRCTTFARNRTI